MRKSDAELCALFHRSLEEIRAWRKPRLKLWSAEEDRILGCKSDREVAKLLGRPVYSVTYRRRQLGVEYAAAKYYHWTADQEKWLGKMPDAEIARRIGRGVAVVQARRRKLGVYHRRPSRHKKWSPAEDRLLGTQSDEQLAKLLGRTRHSVGSRRRTLGIRTPDDRSTGEKLASG